MHTIMKWHYVTQMCHGQVCFTYESGVSEWHQPMLSDRRHGRYQDCHSSEIRRKCKLQMIHSAFSHFKTLKMSTWYAQGGLTQPGSRAQMGRLCEGFTTSRGGKPWQGLLCMHCHGFRSATSLEIACKVTWPPDIEAANMSGLKHTSYLPHLNFKP